MPVLPAIIGGVAGIASSAIGAVSAGADRDAATAASQRAMQQIQAIGAPPDLAKSILLKEFQSAGVLTPEMEQNIHQGFSEMSKIQENPEYQQAQQQALQLLSQRAQTGLGPEDRAAFNQLQSQVRQDTEGKRQQILQQMQARGLAGSGAELAAQLSAAQGGAQQASQAGDQIAAQASRNALQAIGSMGQLGTQVRGQEFGMAEDKAKAQDIINQFNTQNQVAQQQRNVQAANAGQLFNLQNAQNISNANTAMQNQEQQRQLEAQRQNWLDQMYKAQAMAQPSAQAAQAYQQRAQATQQAGQNIGTGLTQAGTALSGYLTKKSGDGIDLGGVEGPTPMSQQIANYKLPF